MFHPGRPLKIALMNPSRALAVDLVEGGDVVVDDHLPVADRGLGAVLDVAAGVEQGWPRP